jgi:hypothetical protein
MSWFLRMILIVLPAVIVAYSYVSWRMVAALGQLTSWPRPAIRWSTAAVAGYLNLYPLLLLAANLFQMSALNNALRGGRRWIDVLITFPFWGGLIVVAELVPLLLLMDLSRLPLWPLFQKYRPLWTKWQAIITVTLFAIFAVYVTVRVVHDTYSVQLTAREVRIPSLPAELEGFRIVQLSDLQADPYTDEQKMQKYIDLANAQKPDLILFGGDLVTRGTDHIAEGAKMMGRLHARLGVYSCLGDHDYWAGAEPVAQHLNHNGVITLEDSVLTLAASASKISLTIITNVYSRRPSVRTFEELRQRRPRDAAVHILLSHQPSQQLIEFAQTHGYHLLLAGHTHGGQVVFKPFGITLSVSHFETPFYSGFYEIGNLLLSVTNGLGLTIAPVRYQAPAEVTLLTLRRGE